jgi:hypothetical protein
VAKSLKVVSLQAHRYRYFLVEAGADEEAVKAALAGQGVEVQGPNRVSFRATVKDVPTNMQASYKSKLQDSVSSGRKAIPPKVGGRTPVDVKITKSGGGK